MYKPPFTVTDTMLRLAISITEKAEKMSSFRNLDRMPQLRRNDRIRSIHSSLAIEANSLSLAQVEDVIAGKPVVGPQEEIQEVKNAYKAYEAIRQFDAYEEKDLLKAHGILTFLLETEAGQYRSHPEGVKNGGGEIIHIAPGEKMVPSLMKELFAWLQNDEETPILLKSCVFHYELVFIHPFGNGNGRVARLWQNVILTRWKPLFEYVPIESQIQKYQEPYYKAIDESNKKGDSSPFVVFMLKMLDETLDELMSRTEKESLSVSEQVRRLLGVMEPGIAYSANELMNRLGIKTKETLRATYLNPAIRNGLVKMTLPDKTKSKNQKYYR